MDDVWSSGGSSAGDTPSGERTSQPPCMDLLDHLGQGCELEALAELAEIRTRVTGWGRMATEVLEQTIEADESLRSALAAARLGLAPKARDWRELRTAFRRLRCLVDHVAMAPDGPALDELEVHYAQTDLAELTGRACEAFAALARAREVELEVELEHTLEAEVDPAKVELALVNLLFNAFKATPRSSRVRVELRRVGDEVVLAVTDGGPGLSTRRARALFHRGRDSDRSESVAVGSLPMSLATSRDFVALHGGTLVVGRCEDDATTFVVRLPLTAPRGARFAPAAPSDLAQRAAALAHHELDAEESLPAAPDPEDGRPLVLVVEDSRSIQRVLVEALRDDVRVVCAFDGREGLERAVTLQPDLVLSDLRMPNMDGEQMLVGIRSDLRTGEIPVIIVTGTDDPRRHVRLLEQGAQDVMRKPFLVAEVRARVKNLLASKRARDVLAGVIGRHETDLVALAQQVSDYQGELRSALTELEATSAIKTNFLRMMSHELKTPITAMQLNLRLLQRELDGDHTPSLAERLGRITRSSERLLQLVDTILAWARVESGGAQLEVEHFDLSEVLTRVVASFGEMARQRGLTILRSPGCSREHWIDSDPRMVALVISGLLTHALQVTERGAVRLDVVEEGEQTCVRVIDGGRPIPRHLREELFEPLHRANDLRTRDGAGSGLGLYVVRDIARALDGDVGLDGDSPTGNAVVLRLSTLPPERTTARVFVGRALRAERVAKEGK